MQNSPARSGIDVGSVIADTYTIEALIGRGGMGAVFLASHKRLPGKQVAIKVLHAEMSGDEVLARFKREAEIASRLGHPNIVAVHDFNVTPDGTPYLVLEYLRGESLAQRLRNGPLPLEQALSIVRQVGSALAATHREGIVHRDLKPQNIFLVPTEVDGRIVEIAKVLDFGISKIRGSTTVKTQDSALLGTPQYMAPEQATGQHKLVDERTDVFAFGAIVYEMLSGQPAFSGETIPEVVFKVVYEQPTPLAQLASVPEPIVAAVHRAMAKQADERFANVSEFVEALTGQPVAPGRAGNSIPPPDVGFAAGSRAAPAGPNTAPMPNTGRTPNTGRDAFAQTMGSEAPSVQTAQQPAPSLQQQPPPSLQQQQPAPSLQQQRAQELGTAGTVSAHPPPAKKRTGLIVVCVLAASAIAAATMFVVMRGRTPERVASVDKPAIADAAVALVAPDAAIVTTPEIEAPPARAERPNDEPPPGDKPPVDTSPIDKPSADKPSADKPSADKPVADKPVADKPPADKPVGKSAGTKPPSTAQKPVAKPPVDDEVEDGDEAVKQKLVEAQAALTANRWDRAEQLANMVSTSEDANPRQRARATLIYGMLQCMVRNDESRARASLRKLVAAPKLRKKLLDTCHAANYLQDVRR